MAGSQYPQASEKHQESKRSGLLNKNHHRHQLQLIPLNKLSHHTNTTSRTTVLFLVFAGHHGHLYINKRKNLCTIKWNFSIPQYNLSGPTQPLSALKAIGMLCQPLCLNLLAVYLRNPGRAPKLKEKETANSQTPRIQMHKSPKNSSLSWACHHLSMLTRYRRTTPIHKLWPPRTIQWEHRPCEASYGVNSKLDQQHPLGQNQLQCSIGGATKSFRYDHAARPNERIETDRVKAKKSCYNCTGNP